MRPWIKNLLQFFLGVGLAAGLLYLTYKDTDLNELLEMLLRADGFWLLMNGVFLLLSYVLRALRWKMMLDNAGYPVKTGTTILSVIIAYLVNTATPRLGEVARCSAIYRTDRVPVAGSLGTVLTERVIDLIVLLLGVGVIVLFELDRLSYFLEGDSGGDTSGLVKLIIALGVAAVLGLGALIWILRAENATGFIGKVRGFIMQMLEAARSIFKLDRPWLFLTYTVLIWVSLVLMMYFVLLALPESSGLGIYYGTLLLFIGGIGWALPAPGGMGSTHIIVTTLFVAFGHSETLGGAVAALSNGATTVFTVFFGAVAVIMFFFVRTKNSP
jgi:uncharacterized protein (TIRG00374 family)